VRGQINFEFLAAAALYVIAVAAVLFNASSFIPDYRQEVASASKHTEARAITTTMLTEPGSHEYGSGGSAWERNSSTQDKITGVGLASGFHELDRYKVLNLSTVGETGLNYTEFRQVSGVANQYRMRFVLTPVIETPLEFRKDNPPDSPDIRTPENRNFSRAGNIVHYGNDTVNGGARNFLVTSHDATYDTVYISDGDWDFTSPTTNRTTGQSFSIGSDPDLQFDIDQIQNRRRDRGAAVFVSSDLKNFGANPDSSSDIVSMDRYATLDGEPARLEVLVW
jgi:hypothetical protein